MSRCRLLRNASRLQLAAVAFLFLLSTSLSFSPSTSSSGPHQHGRLFLLIILDPSERTKSPCTSIHDARQQQHQQQGIFEAFFSFISRGVFSAVDVNNDGRIEDTEVEVAILKVRGSVGKRAVRSSAGGGGALFWSLSHLYRALTLFLQNAKRKKKKKTQLITDVQHGQQAPPRVAGPPVAQGDPGGTPQFRLEQGRRA
jgi:hypothetical protein